MVPDYEEKTSGFPLKVTLPHATRCFAPLRRVRLLKKKLELGWEISLWRFWLMATVPL